MVDRRPDARVLSRTRSLWFHINGPPKILDSRFEFARLNLIPQYAFMSSGGGRQSPGSRSDRYASTVPLGRNPKTWTWALLPRDRSRGHCLHTTGYYCSHVLRNTTCTQALSHAPNDHAQLGNVASICSLR